MSLPWSDPFFLIFFLIGLALFLKALLEVLRRAMIWWALRRPSS